MNDCGRIVIIGAGPCGLGAALWLTEHGYENFVVLEKEAYPGGLAASFVDNAGFLWDLGGHVAFSHYTEFDAILDRAVPDWVVHNREAWIRTKGRWVPYPFQYNIDKLDPLDRDAILAELRVRSSDSMYPLPTESFAEWIKKGFGPTLERIFMRPYNWKGWGHPLEMMGTRWIRERVAGPDYERVRRSIGKKVNEAEWGPNARFRYPKIGGTGAIWKGAASFVKEGKILYNTKIAKIDCNRRIVKFTNGGEERYDHLISSAPLDLLCKSAIGLNSHVSRAANGLAYSSTHVIGIGLKGRKPADMDKKCWIYFPDDTSPYYRVTHFSHYGPGNAPRECWSLMAEVSESFYKPVDADNVVMETVQAMRADGLVHSNAEIVSTWHKRLERGYPTPLHNRDTILHEVLPVLEQNGIISRGRFGGWKYEIGNMDHSYMQGREAASSLVAGVTENTWRALW